MMSLARSWRRASRLFGLYFVSLTGCHISPKYTRPSVPVPPAFRGAENNQVVSEPTNSIGDEEWSAVFRRPELQQFMGVALANNFDIHIAAQRVSQASAEMRVVRSQFFPQIQATGTGFGPQLPAIQGATTQSVSTSGSLGLSANWIPDFWGSYRKQTTAGQAQFLAQVWAKRAVRLTLVEHVVSLYFQLSALTQQLAITQQMIMIRQQSVELTRARQRAGSTTLIDVRQAEQLLYTATSELPQLKLQIQQTENALRLLAGDLPGSVVQADQNALQPPPSAVPIGIPSQLLERRPDIQQAEQMIIAANAQIGVARAQLFPQVNITGSAFLGGNSLNALFDPSAGVAYGIGLLLQPVFTGGRLRAQVRLSEAEEKEMLWTYRKTVANAFREVSDALIAAKEQQSYREEQSKLVVAAEEAAQLALLRYRAGSTSYLEFLITDSVLYSARLNEVDAREREALSLVRLYVVLGGGWQV